MSPESEQELVAGVGEIKGLLNGQNVVLEEHGRLLKDMSYAIDGNKKTGTPGLITVVTGHDQFLSTVKRVAWIVLTPLLAGLGGGILAIFMWLTHR